MRMTVMLKESPNECKECHGPLPCDCWKGKISPARREALQELIINKYLCNTKNMEPISSLIKGEFGNKNAAKKIV